MRTTQTVAEQKIPVPPAESKARNRFSFYVAGGRCPLGKIYPFGYAKKLKHQLMEDYFRPAGSVSSLVT